MDEPRQAFATFSEVEMTVPGTPVEYHEKWGLWVKREDLCCPGGPHFSKCRGVFAHAKGRPESLIGVLDTSHSQGGHAVARAAQMLGKRCWVYYPVFKGKPDRMSESQIGAARHGAILRPLQAGRSAVIYHQAKKDMIELRGGYMFPNALKLLETVEETKQEVLRTQIPPEVQTVLISASSGTIAAGVIAGLFSRHGQIMQFGSVTAAEREKKVIVHLGYSRSEKTVRDYIDKMVGWRYPYTVVDEGYKYTDAAHPGPTPDFPCDKFYDLKALRWWLREGKSRCGVTLLWNVG